MCWGGKNALRAALESNMISLSGDRKGKVPPIDAVVALHPSNLIIPEDVDGIVVPTTIGWGLKDISINIKQMTQVQEVHVKAETTERRLRRWNTRSIRREGIFLRDG
jgi:dienelactone hydrolase